MKIENQSFSGPKEKVIEYPKINNQDIYEVINSFLKDRGSKYITENRMLLNDNELIEIKNLDTLFSKNDVEFIKVQNIQRESFILNEKFTKGFTVISLDSLQRMRDDKTQKVNFWTSFNEKYHQKELLTVSLPLFSIDKNIAIITTNTICSTCINSTTWVYKRINGEWKIYSPIFNVQN
jgi:hypothetical protein